MTTSHPLLGGLSPSTFLRDHWQKKPLLIRQAIPGFTGFVSKEDLARWARRDDVMSRLVTTPRGRNGAGKPELDHGPFDDLDLNRLPAPWSLLVQGIENLHPGGWELLAQFDFLPRTRLDDVMVSYASVGGGVGPHVDKYDVFLLQGTGRRRWRIAEGGNKQLDADSELPTLKKFVAEQEWVLEPGDMLYLPPGVAHEGVAVDGPCMTWSIGAVAPTHESLLQNYLVFKSQSVDATIDMEAMYEDKDLAVPVDNVAIDDVMFHRVNDLLQERLKVDPVEVQTYLGRLLTGPKPHIEFKLPKKELSDVDVNNRLRNFGALKLALPTRGLVRGTQVFVNGEFTHLDGKDLDTAKKLLRDRQLALPFKDAGEAFVDAVVTWHNQGFVVFEAGNTQPKR